MQRPDHGRVVGAAGRPRVDLSRDRSCVTAAATPKRLQAGRAQSPHRPIGREACTGAAQMGAAGPGPSPVRDTHTVDRRDGPGCCRPSAGPAPAGAQRPNRPRAQVAAERRAAVVRAFASIHGGRQANLRAVGKRGPAALQTMMSEHADGRPPPRVTTAPPGRVRRGQPHRRSLFDASSSTLRERPGA